MESVDIRDATVADMAAVTTLYNALIPTTTVAWTEELEHPSTRVEWFVRQTLANHPVLVADADGVVVGFASYGSFRGEGRWPGYRSTVEHTIHVAQAAWGRGVGRQLLTELIDRAADAGIHAVVGAVDADNIESIRFHERLGFAEVARMPQVGLKFGRRLDLVLLQRVLADGDDAPGG